MHLVVVVMLSGGVAVASCHARLRCAMRQWYPFEFSLCLVCSFTCKKTVLRTLAASEGEGACGVTMAKRYY